MGYLTNFIVYTLAMVGVIMLAVFVFKTTTLVSTKGASKFLKVHDTLSLGPRKILYIVSAGEEKFLIAGDIDKTSLISKLETGRNSEQISVTKTKDVEISSKQLENSSFQNILGSLPTKNSYVDRGNIGIYKTQNKPYDSVMKNLAERIRQ